MEDILLPSTIQFKETEDPNVGSVVITPCHQGYGTTIGNALRRVLLSSLPGAAIESIKIDGAQHEFSAIDGVKEDVIEVILNIKELAVKSHSDETVTLSLTKKGKGDVTAGDFDKNSDIEIMNPDLKLCTVTDDSKTFSMEVTIGRGRGYIAAAEKDTKQYDLGTIAVDSMYTPIRDVGYDVQMTRVGDVTNYEKLSLRVVTDGTMTPKDAVGQSVKILMDHFSLILDVAQNGGMIEPAFSADVEDEVEIAEEEPVEDDSELSDEKTEE